MLKARETHSWKRLLPNQSASFFPSVHTKKNRKKRCINIKTLIPIWPFLGKLGHNLHTFEVSMNALLVGHEAKNLVVCPSV